MEIINYSEEHKIFRDSLRKFLDKEVIPHIEEWEEAGIVPRSVWKKMGEQGFLCTSVPEEYSGLAADFLYSVIITEETTTREKSGFSGLTASLHSDIVVPYITSFASEEQKHKYLPGLHLGDIITAVAMTEPNAGSDSAAMKTTSSRRRRSYRLKRPRPSSATASIATSSLWPPETHRLTIPIPPRSFPRRCHHSRFRERQADQKDRLAQPGHGGNVLYRLPDSQGK